MRVSKGIGVQIEAPLWNPECSQVYSKCVGQIPVVVENRSRTKPMLVEGFELVDAGFGNRRV